MTAVPPWEYFGALQSGGVTQYHGLPQIPVGASLCGVRGLKQDF